MNAQENFSIPCPELLAQFAVPGPRYTSYPTAPQFHSGVDSAEALRAYAELGDEPIALYVHIPFCQKLCLYCACNVVVSQSRSIASQYMDELTREVLILREALGDRRLPVRSLHLGGGTPTFLTPGELVALHRLLEEHFDFGAVHEQAIEVDPRSCTPSHLSILRELGYQRLSMGIQDFDEKVQDAIGRHQSVTQTQDLVELARELGFTSVNFDLVYGLPEQSAESFEATLQTVLTMRPDRLACFGYAHVPWARPAQKVLERYDRATPHERIERLHRTLEAARGAGYDYVGLDHFALPDDALAVAAREGSLRRNFQGYTAEPSRTTLALGVTGISELDVGHGLYLQNSKELGAYRERLAKGEAPVVRGYRLSPEDALRRDIIMTLMCGQPLIWSELREAYPWLEDDFLASSLDHLEQYRALGFVDVTEVGVEVRGVGRFLVRNICMAFDRYLINSLPSFSQAV